MKAFSTARWIVVWFWGLTLASGIAQTSVVSDLDVRLEFPGYVTTQARLPDGSIALGGSFHSVQRQASASLARLNADGTLIANWAPLIADGVNAVIATNGGLYVGGDFQSINWQTAHRYLVRLRTDTGTVDTAWNASPNDEVSSIAADANYLYVGGYFTNIGGANLRYLARLSHVDGKADTNWTPNPNSRVVKLLMDGDSLYVSGAFTNIDGMGRTRLAKFNLTDGHVAASFNARLDYEAYTMAADDTSLYLGGDFSTVNGTNRQFLAKLTKANGTLESGWNPELSDRVYALSVVDGALLVGGSFTQICSQPITACARLDTQTGALLGGFTNIENYRIADGGATVLSFLLTESHVWVGGFFPLAGGGISINSLARMSRSTGALDATYNGDVTTEGALYALARQDDGKLVLGGLFTMINGIPCSNLGRVSAEGILDEAWQPAPNNPVRCLAITNDAIYAGGEFSYAGGRAQGRLGRFNLTNGLADPAFQFQANGSVKRIAAWDGDLFAGGSFTQVNAQAVGYLARVDAATGALRGGWTNRINDNVYALKVHQDALYVGGWFTNVNGVTRRKLAKFDLQTSSLDLTWTNGIFGDGGVMDMDHDGIGMWTVGEFTNVNGRTSYLMARFRDNGTLNTMGTNVVGEDIRCVHAGANGYAYLGGNFESIGGVTSPNLARVNIQGVGGAADPNWVFAPNGSASTVHQILEHEANVYAGGHFILFGNTYRFSFASITHPAPSLALLSPTDGMCCRALGSFTMEATAAAMPPLSVTQVVFYANYSIAATFTNPPYIHVFTNLPEGSYTLVAKAWDNYFRTATTSITVSVTPGVVAADFDGDRQADPGLVVDGGWYVWLSGAGYQRVGPFPFGTREAVPVPADFDGDRKADPATVEAGQWSIWLSGAGYRHMGPYPFGDASAIPAPADFDGDHKADPAMVADGQWRIWLSAAGYAGFGPYPFGSANLTPVPADYDADAKADPAMTSGALWYAWLSRAGYAGTGALPIGLAGSQSVAADFDGDGYADPAVYVNGQWFAWLSSAHYARCGPYPLTAP